MKVRVADYIKQFLEEKNITHVFLVSGGGMMHLLDAISCSDKIQYICNHHEQSSAMAAEAYARKTGKLGVCYATSGPGATNILTGLVGAWQDSSPVLYITGQSKLSQTIRHTHLEKLRQFGTFEVDIVPIVQSVTKYAIFLDDPTMIKYHLEKAYQLATEGRPGPVLIDIPIDIQSALIEPEHLQGYPKCDQNESNDLKLSTLESILKRLTCAKRPVILAGHGVRVSKSTSLFREVIERLNIPVVTTQLAKDLIEYDHPLFIGHAGMKGDRAGNFALQNSDVILVLGSSLHVLTTGYELKKFAPNAYKIQVEIDNQILAREQVGVNEKIQCGIKEFLAALLPILKNNIASTHQKTWLQLCQKWKYELAVQNEPHKKESHRINYYEVIDSLSELCPSKATIITDAGSAFYVVGQAFRVKQGQRVIISGALGTMGYALPASTGACFADPDNLVVCITGDGSLQTNIHELATIRFHNLNVKIFIMNNGGYISIKNTQANFFNGHLAGVAETTGVSFPDLKKLALAYHLPYFSIDSPTKLDAIISKVLNKPGPVICEILADQEQLIIPTVSSQKLSDGSMASKPLDDMFPFMSEEKRKAYLNFE